MGRKLRNVVFALLAVGGLRAAEPGTASAQVPLLQGTVYNPVTGVTFGLFTEISTTSNPFGYWLRVYLPDSTVMELVPVAAEGGGILYEYTQYVDNPAQPNNEAFWRMIITGQAFLATDATGRQAVGEWIPLVDFRADPRGIFFINPVWGPVAIRY